MNRFDLHEKTVFYTCRVHEEKSYVLIGPSDGEKGLAQILLNETFLQELTSCIYEFVTFLSHHFFVDMVNDAVIPMAAVGIQYFAGPVVTILASKTSRTYTPTCYYFTILTHVTRLTQPIV